MLMKQLYTRWGRELDPQNVLPEYPRPLLRRSSYTNLNGYWDYAFTREFKIPEKYDGQILVPFSPEAVLSGVSRQLMARMSISGIGVSLLSKDGTAERAADV